MSYSLKIDFGFSRPQFYDLTLLFKLSPNQNTSLCRIKLVATIEIIISVMLPSVEEKLKQLWK